MAFEDLPTVKLVLNRIEDEEDGLVTYQGIVLKRHEQSLTFLRAKTPEWIDSLEGCIQVRIRNDEKELLNNCITILATNGWEQNATATFGYNALENVCSRLRISLQKANFNCLLVPEEWDSMLDYAKRYLTLQDCDAK